MPFGALTRSKSYRQLWRRSETRTPPPGGRGPASLVLGSDATDETAVLRVGDTVEVGTTGLVNDAKRLEVRGEVRLNAAPPVGYMWRVALEVDAHTVNVDFSESRVGALAFPVSFDLSDIAPNVAGLAGSVAVNWSLTLLQDPDNAGSATDDVQVVLPSVYIDRLIAPEVVPADLYLESRSPAPQQRNVPNALPTISFTLADLNGAGVDLANTTVTVDGAVAYTGGAFVAPWSGTATAGVGPTSADTVFVLNVPATLLPYSSEQLVEVAVTSELNGGLSPLSETWAFISADTIPPALQRAVMTGKRTLRVFFTDGVLLDDSDKGALNPDNYAITRVSQPTASLSVVAVTTVSQSSSAVDLHFDTEATFSGDYAVIARRVVDDAGNVLDPQGRRIRFVGFQPPRPDGRRFELLDFMPDFNVAEDRTATEGGCETSPGSGDLRRFLSVLQEVVDLLLCSVDSWTDIIDIDLAPEAFLDAILQDLGNPFAQCISDLTVIEKRRLARILISIYKQKGTPQGVINAIRFFTGIEVTLDVINARQFWQLNVSLLGINTTLAPGVGSPLWYSFFVVSPVVLTDDQRSRILCIADYMKAAHEHILGVLEPGNMITPSDYWILNVSLLGATSPPATILA